MLWKLKIKSRQILLKLESVSKNGILFIPIMVKSQVTLTSNITRFKVSQFYYQPWPALSGYRNLISSYILYTVNIYINLYIYHYYYDNVTKH